MFTGIIQEIGEVESVEYAHEEQGALCVRIASSESLCLGCSIAIDGVCLTLVKQEGNILSFDMITETLKSTTLSHLRSGDRVNVERSLKVGEEIGGHLVSGHVCGVGKILSICHHRYTFQVPTALAVYLFEKAFIAIDGISLTLCDVHEDTGIFSVGLIPETLRRTTLGSKGVGDLVNIEPETTTRVQVDTLRRVLNTIK